MRADVYLQAVLEKCDALTRSGLWAPSPYLRPEAWLGNFKTDQDRLLAATLLDNFVFYSDRATDQLLRASHATLEDNVLTDATLSTQEAEDLLGSAVLTPIEGEIPNRTDSGNLLCRRARNVLGILQSRVKDPKGALIAAQAGTGVILVDDFLGSGEQFVHTWCREYAKGSVPSRFSESYAAKPFPVFLLALVATSAAITRIRREVPNIRVAVAHVLDETSSVHKLTEPPLHPPLINFQAAMADFLLRHAPALKVPSFMLRDDWPAYGLVRFGLLFAFEHSIPDATLPIFWANEGPSWVPLARPR
jgi:hypothetical protein